MRPLPDGSPAAQALPARGRRSALFLLVVGGAYFTLLLYVDRGNGILARLAELGGPLTVCVALVLTSFVLRYQRWRMALDAQGHRHIGWLTGLQAYLAGFAFTVSPGKAGELLRIRYFGQMSVPPKHVLATFLFERGLDLAVLTLLGIAAAPLIPAFGTLAAVVLGLLLALCVACWSTRLRAALWALASRLPGTRPRQLAQFLIDGVGHAGPLLRPGVVVPGMALGTLAWLLTAAAFTYLCQAMGLTLTWQHALGIYPLAMLAGAATFVPGGVGTTEAAIVLMLGALGTPVGVALAIAVGIRLASLWLAIVVGMLAMLSLELRARRGNAR
jgi:uncharacterized protein (TIRG00374 family)